MHPCAKLMLMGFGRLGLAALTLLLGCTTRNSGLGEAESDGGEGSAADDGGVDGGDGVDDGADDDDGGSSASGTEGETGGEEGLCQAPWPWARPDPPAMVGECENDPSCGSDRDGDGISSDCDNDYDFNPDQSDMDGDGFGDGVDTCPADPNPGTNTADADNDGIGSNCDQCRQMPKKYNEFAEDNAVSAYMYVRNIPITGDADRDGIGDVCDNCVRTANCDGYGPQNPWGFGDPIEYTDPAICQTDDDRDMIGDACAVAPPFPDAAGPVGLEDDHDFDQDGLRNVVDFCPRQPVVHEACAGGSPCTNGAACVEGVCNHTDVDGDLVGDICDTCPTLANPMQVTEGGEQEDDLDQDFVGAACEQHEDCLRRKNPRFLAFYDLHAGGQCCTSLYPGDDALVDPHGIPIRVDCPDTDEELGICRALPENVRTTPGMLELPPGCPAEGTPVTLDDVGGDVDALWAQYFCLLPVADHDFDGIPDQCDRCRFSFDPTNETYVDDEGKEWPDHGKFCQGEYGFEQCCANTAS